MIFTNNYKMLHIGGIKDASSLFYYLWMVLFFPVLEMMLFSGPLYLVFKIKGWIWFFSTIGLVVVSEYFVYVYFTSQRHINMKGIYIELIDLVVLGGCFFKEIIPKFKRTV